MSDFAIEVKDVTKIYKLYGRSRDRLLDAFGLAKNRYREHHALSHMDFSVKKGECVGLIGTNGAGKSTILKIITGVLSPTFGEVKIDGRISALLELGAGFNVEYTGIENIYLNGTMTGFSKDEVDERMEDILSFADIGDFVNQPVKTYSSGMFVRLAFAIAINIDPEILIVDEALSVGDVFFQAKCYKKFEEFKEQGKTILFVSHDLSSVQKYCDRAILLDHGRKVSEDTPKAIIDLYKRILVGEDVESILSGEEDEEPASTSGEGLDKSHLTLNPQLSEYGDQKAEIVDFGIFDDQGRLGDTLIKDNEYTIRMRIKAYEDIYDPIVAYTIRNIKGVEITGTNTKVEKSDIGPMKAGEERIVIFRQKMNLQGGAYLLSLGLTRYDRDDFHVYHRLYDVISLNVVSIKNTVGFFDPASKITIQRVD